MFKLTMTALGMFFICSLQAQTPVSLAGTGWKGSMSVPDPIVCIMKFEKDTFRIIYAGAQAIPLNTGEGMRVAAGKDSASIENMVYKLHGDTLMMTKISGGSPCDSRPATYKVNISGGMLKLTVINDPCDVRPYAVGGEMTKVW